MIWGRTLRMSNVRALPSDSSRDRVRVRGRVMVRGA